jgi:mannose-6-phosphate isomerase-like protein (cupin superfamily)
MSKQIEVPSWVKDRKQWHSAHSSPKYFAVPEGETTIEIDLNNPAEEREGDFGKQFVYHIKVNEEHYLLSASVTLDRLVISALSEGINPMTLIRTGTKKQTRYSIKELAKKR